MLITEAERKDAVKEVANLICSTGLKAVIFRCTPGEKLYGSDDEQFITVGEIAVEMVQTPPEELAGKIDASISVLPDENIQTEDRLFLNGLTYRIQTITEESFFGIITHKVAKLVKIN